MTIDQIIARSYRELTRINQVNPPGRSINRAAQNLADSVDRVLDDPSIVKRHGRHRGEIPEPVPEAIRRFLMRAISDIMTNLYPDGWQSNPDADPALEVLQQVFASKMDLFSTQPGKID